jgi:ribonuclease III
MPVNTSFSFDLSHKAVLEFIQHLQSKIARLASLPVRGGRAREESVFPPVGFLTAEKTARLEAILNVEIHSVPCFEQALIHRSYLQKLRNTQIYSNERLEFFGDAILSAVIAEYLFDMRSDILEGELTKMRSWLVNKKSLAYCARKLKLHEFLMVSLSARQSLAQGNDSILADALEAIIAAIYLDSGADEAKTFILNSVLLHVMNEDSLMRDTNYKSILLEQSQSRGTGIPIYHVVDETGPDHKRIYTVEVHLMGVPAGVGTGRNKKDAEQDAANVALTAIREQDAAAQK